MRSSSGTSASDSRCAMPLDGSSSRTTVGRWATTQARSTTRRDPVDSSRTNFERKAPRPSRSMSSSTRSRIFSSESKAAGRWSAALSGSRTSIHRSSATAIVSSTVSAGQRRASWNERPSPRRARRCAGSLVMSTPPSSSRPPSAGVKPGDDVEQGGLAGAVGADDAEDLAGRDRDRHVVDRPDAAEAAAEPVGGERRPGRGRAGDAGSGCSVSMVAASAATIAAAASTTISSSASPSSGGSSTGAAEAADAAPSRNTERSTSGRSSSSAVGPWKRISPFSMKNAVSATSARRSPTARRG